MRQSERNPPLADPDSCGATPQDIGEPAPIEIIDPITWQDKPVGEHLQASEELVGQVLGHSKLSRIGITAAYDKAERMGARGQLLEAWARKLVEAANGKVESNVVPMRVS